MNAPKTIISRHVSKFIFYRKTLSELTERVFKIVYSIQQLKKKENIFLIEVGRLFSKATNIADFYFYYSNSSSLKD